jgi:hypothetical protein
MPCFKKYHFFWFVLHKENDTNNGKQSHNLQNRRNTTMMKSVMIAQQGLQASSKGRQHKLRRARRS